MPAPGPASLGSQGGLSREKKVNHFSLQAYDLRRDLALPPSPFLDPPGIAELPEP